MASQPGTKIPGTDLWVRMNKRGHNEYYVSHTHKSIDDLLELIINIRKDEQERITDYMTSDDLEKLQRYIVLNVANLNVIPRDRNTVPHYPRPVEFHVSRISHVTTEEGLLGVLDCGGFRGGTSGLLWWGLVIDPWDFSRAEQRYLEKLFPVWSQEKRVRQKHFLHHFTTSPVFKEESRYGNFRFSFSLADVLQEYSTQFCRGQEPVFRVYETIVYKQEIMYSVLIHSPDVHDYDDYPVLGGNDDGVCAYRDGKIIWRAQAISETHRFRLTVNRQESQVEVEDVGHVFYVWDHVTLAFHLPADKILQCRGLLDSVSACGDGDVPLNPPIGQPEAERIIKACRQRSYDIPGGPQPGHQHQYDSALASASSNCYQPSSQQSCPNYAYPIYESQAGHYPINYQDYPPAPESHMAFDPSYMPGGGHGGFYNGPPHLQHDMYHQRGGYVNPTSNNRFPHGRRHRGFNNGMPRGGHYPTPSNNLQPHLQNQMQDAHQGVVHTQYYNPRQMQDAHQGFARTQYYNPRHDPQNYRCTYSRRSRRNTYHQM